MKILVADSVYCKEAIPYGHLDATCFYLAQMDHDVTGWVLNDGAPPKSHQTDVVYAMDNFGVMAHAWGAVRVAQVAAVCKPMPWECLKSDGTHAYDLILSSIPWMVEAATAAGARARYMPLCFDTRARVHGMGVKRDLGCIFIGTTGPNHQRRTQMLAELADVVTVLPPVFGPEYFKTLARAKVVFNVHAEWARGAANNMRIFEAAGMGCAVVSDGKAPLAHAPPPISWSFDDIASARDAIRRSMNNVDLHVPVIEAECLQSHTYVNRVPQILDLVKELL